MAAKGQPPEIVQLSTAELERLLAEVRELLPPASYALIESLLRTLVWIMGLLEQKQTTIARLRRLIFGEKSEKARKIFPEGFLALAGSAEPKPKRKGHGRKGAKDYRGARRVKVPHPKLHIGDLCPKCLKGKLYLFNKPAQIIRVVAQPIFQATVFELERLRCALCGALLTAPAPAEAGEGKYDSSVGIDAGADTLWDGPAHVSDRQVAEPFRSAFAGIHSVEIDRGGFSHTPKSSMRRSSTWPPMARSFTPMTRHARAQPSARNLAKG